MRVLHVIPSIGPLRGGPSFVVQTLAAALVASGMQVHVASTDDNYPGHLSVPLGVPILRDGVKYWHFRRQSTVYTFSWPLGRWLWSKVSDYDLVHIHALFSCSSTVAAVAARNASVPYIIRPLGILNEWGMVNRRPLLKELSFRLCEKRLLEHARVVQYTTTQERDEAERLPFKAPGCVIPNPVVRPPSVYNVDSGLRMMFPEWRDKTILLFLSRIDAKKGLDLLLRALREVTYTLPNCVLAIAGDGPRELVEKYKADVRELGLQDKVRWIGFIEHTTKWSVLRSADIFILPSYSENFGVAVVEAMYCEKAVLITTGVGLCHEVEKHGAGVVVSPTVTALARAIIQLAARPAERNLMGVRGKELACGMYSVESVCQQITKLYQTVKSSYRF